MKRLIAQLKSILTKLVRIATDLRQPQTGTPGRRALRTISSGDLQIILDEHRKWAESNGVEGKKADLHEINLQKANLIEANLEGAELYGADLEKALLDGANLKGAVLVKANLQEAKLPATNLHKADLTEANLKEANLFCADLSEANLPLTNLQGATLTEANLQKADLFKTILREADLQDADLTSATGLLAGQLAGANVSGAKLPEPILKFEALANVQEASKNASKLFIALLLGCVYSWLTLGTTTDVGLLTNRASSPLPLIGTAIPIVGFYWVAPLVLLGLYLYFHLCAQRLWERLASLPAVFPDGAALDEKAYPWLLNGLVRAYFSRLRANRPALCLLQTFISVLLAWWTVPVTLFFFWMRYLRRHDWVVTTLHIALLVIVIGAAILLQRLAGSTLRGAIRRPFSWNKAIIDVRTYTRAGLFVGIGVIFYQLSVGAIDGVPFDLFNDFPGRSKDFEKATMLQKSVPFVLLILRNHPFMNISNEDISVKPVDWTGKVEVREELVLIKGANLYSENLRYADAFGAFLVKANLSSADLVGADLRAAKLVGAWLDSANLRGAHLNGADLRFAKLTRANLGKAYMNSANFQEADLEGANLSQANLQNTNLQGAVLTRTDLRGADLRIARLKGARLDRANLAGTDLSGLDLTHTTGLAPKQIGSAIIDERTRLPGYLQRPEKRKSKAQ